MSSKGALLELRARGVEEDTMFIGQPEITYFKQIFKRHTNFVRYERSFPMKDGFGFGRKSVCAVDRAGDMLGYMWFRIELPATGNSEVGWINGVGNFMIKDVRLHLGGVEIVKMTGEYIDMYYRYALDSSKFANYQNMVKRVSGFRQTSLTDSQILLVPLPWWFTRRINDTLPTVALQYTDIEIEINFRPINECLYSASARSGLGDLVNLNTLEITNIELFAEFYNLDDRERTEMAEKEHTYIIEQVQHVDYNVNGSGEQYIYDINFNLGVKELIWFYRSEYYENLNRWDKYAARNSSIDATPIIDFGILFNGSDRVILQTAEHARLLQPLRHHNSASSDYIFMYCFAENCNSIQSSGYVNMSRLDKKQLQLKWQTYTGAGTLHVFAINHNVLFIKKGQAGLANMV